jgi:hypothetical protein
MPARLNGQNDSISEVDSAVEVLDGVAMNDRRLRQGGVHASLGARLRQLRHTPSLATRQRNIVDVLLHDALEGDDRQVLSTFEVAHVGLDHRTGPSSKEGVWPRARGSVGVDGNLGERPHHGRGSKRGRRQPEIAQNTRRPRVSLWSFVVTLEKG